MRQPGGEGCCLAGSRLQRLQPLPACLGPWAPRQGLKAVWMVGEDQDTEGTSEGV